jgi:cytochrome P450
MTGPGNPETTPSEGITANAERKNRLNIVSPENLQNPVPLYKELRETDPVHWSNEMGAWFITRYADVVNGFRDPRLSADRSALTEQQMMPLGADLARDFGELTRWMMINRDGTDHTKIRRQASPGFTPQALDVYLPAIRNIMRTLVDRVKHLGHMDVVKEITFQLPPLTLAEFLDVSPEDRTRFQAWAGPLADFFTPKPDANIVELARLAHEAMKELRDYLANLIERRRHVLAPGQDANQDMISRMLHAQQVGKLSIQELVSNSFLMISAGHTTTTDQLSNGIHDLLTYQDQFELLKENRTLLKSAVDEMLRFNPATPFTFRIALTEFQLHGRTIRKGDRVFLGIAAANRDPSVFPEPDRFTITRNHFEQKHLSFGFGPHHCLGVGLARRQLEVAIEHLMDHLPGLRLDETQPPHIKNHGLAFRGFDSLPVRW